MKIINIIREEIYKENKENFQNTALEHMDGDFNSLSDIDKLALLGGSNDRRLVDLDLSKIFKENGGTFGSYEIKIRIKNINDQPINHQFSKEFAGKEGFLAGYINYSSDGLPYSTVRFNNFIKNNGFKGGGIFEERPIFLANMYPFDYDEISNEFSDYRKRVEKDREDFMNRFNDDFND